MLNEFDGLCGSITQLCLFNQLGLLFSPGILDNCEQRHAEEQHVFYGSVMHLIISGWECPSTNYDSFAQIIVYEGCDRGRYRSGKGTYSIFCLHEEGD